MVAWHTAGITSFNELLSKEFLVAIAGTAGDAGVFGSAMNGIMGTRLKMICCYGGSAARTSPWSAARSAAGSTSPGPS